MKRVDWNKYFSLLIMISFLRAVPKNYVIWRGNIPAIIFQNFYCWVTWDNTKLNTSNALHSQVYPIDPPATLSPCDPHYTNTILYKAINVFYTCSTSNTSVCIHVWLMQCMLFKLQQVLSRLTSAPHYPLSIQKSWISYVGKFVCSACTHMLKAIWPFY